MNIPPHLLNEHFDDRYFDVVSAVQEARLIYVKGAGIESLFSGTQSHPERFIIGETGFGAGRLFATLVDFFDRCGARGITVDYNSVELYPISADRMRQILDPFRPELGSIIDEVADRYQTLDINQPGWHRCVFERDVGTITLNLWIGEALAMVQSLSVPCNVWFLDGHGPKKNPEIWRPELLTAIGKKTAIGGTVATYTVAGHVRRDLETAGFVVEKVPGFGGKKTVLRGFRKADIF